MNTDTNADVNADMNAHCNAEVSSIRMSCGDSRLIKIPFPPILETVNRGGNGKMVLDRFSRF